MSRTGVTERYARAFAERLGASRAFCFWKGRVALYAILRALGVGEGDAVIVPGYTCVMNVNPIKYLKAKPVYVDIEPDTFNMNVDLLADKITPNTKVLIAQHTYGYPCEMDILLDIAEGKGVTVIEDCCLALGSEYKGRTVGTLGRAAYFSSQWNKPYTTGLGGVAITNDQELADKIELVRSEQMVQPSGKEAFMLWVQLLAYRLLVYPRTTVLAQRMFRYLTKQGAVVGSSSSSEYEPVMSGDFFKAMSRVQARSGLGQLGRLEQNFAHRRRMAQLYDELLEEKGWSGGKYDRSVLDPVLVRYPVRIEEKDRAVAESASSGIELGSWFECPLHPIETPLGSYDYEMGMCPEAEKASREVVNLPLHPRVNEATVKKTVEFITRFTQVR